MTTETAQTIVLVDDEENILKASRLILLGNGFGNVVTLQDSRQLMPLLEQGGVAAVVLDLFMPHLSGTELLPLIVERFPHIPAIVMTAVDETETAVTCMKSGAFDYLVKPVESGRLIASVTKALEMGAMSRELNSLKECLLDDRLDHPEAFASIVTDSKKMRAVFQYLEVVSRSRQPILVTGETGVGKELFARAVHELSGVRGEFVAVNVAGLDDVMFSDTLFGHKKGAFTGADQARDGLIARAAGGTLFLDEIGDLNEASQIKLLRLLQEKEYYPVGSDMARKSEARIVCATNRDLKKQIEKEAFRNDLYYRLCAHQVQIPPLRERLEDLPLLIDYFLGEAAASLGRKKPTPPPELLTLLSVYSFPGNVRELQALIHDAVARHGSGVLSLDSFRNIIGGDAVQLIPQAAVTSSDDPLSAIFGRFPTVREVEDYLMAEAMKRARGNQGIAATMLGITRQTLNKRLQAKKG
ncbi:sigma-54-dependent transcriptional regulator [Geobacter sulfurreducens]|uniref:sigma-54-dependent transcriptional regulator n=1 Tax=Geobacter sulfurreducens TaxID=35554 RepID=UPI000DBBA778|nr:sigma-54 dependent transcriptional regulator [Geobacter sulfurreducens]BBA69774.1 Transcriptional regulatory protein ZraR [Geobacter sulfurreducens]